MDDLDRLYRRLLTVIRTTRPEYTQIPFTVQELVEQLIPYRHNRRELEMDTNQDYELAVARLLSGERDYVQTEPSLQEAVRHALASETDDPSVFKEYAEAHVQLMSPGPIPAAAADRTAVARPPAPPVTPVGSAPTPFVAPPAAPTTPPTTPITAPITAPTAAAPAMDRSAASSPETVGSPAVPSLLSSLSNIAVPTGCRFCGGTLPTDRDVSYCPHCGENLKTRRCPACGAEMEAGWRFCVTCGRKAS